MMVILTQNRSKKALGGKTNKFATLIDEQWEELYENALSTI